MAAPTRAPRTRASGGRTLMLLGVLLAFAAGVIVIYVVSQATGTTAQSVTVVVAKQDIPPQTILNVSDSSNRHMLISDAFVEKSVPSDFAPANAYIFTTQEKLDIDLNNQVVIGTFYAGEILRQSDPRLVPLGVGAAGSMTNINPAELKTGMVITQLKVDGNPNVVAGDTVDVLVTECNLDGMKAIKGCETATTLQDITIYSVSPGGIYVVVDHQQALVLKYLSETGRVQLVIRRPGDDASVTTATVDGATIVSEFHY